MIPYRKVVWTEGLVLTQHHLQEWERQNAVQLKHRFLNYFPFGWGVVKLEIVEEALLNGVFRVKECQIIFPNGDFVGFDEACDKPLSYDLSQHSRSWCRLYLCWPIKPCVSSIPGYPLPSDLCAWEAEYQKVKDENNEALSREILLAQPRLSLRAEEDKGDGVISIKIADLMRQGEMRWEQSPTFVPSVLRLQSSSYLKSHLQSLLLVLQSKKTELKQNAENKEIRHTLALQKITEAYIALSWCDQVYTTPPSQVYFHLVDLFYGLCLFLDLKDEPLPPYAHDDLYGTFSHLFEKVHRILTEEFKINAPALRLKKIDQHRYLLEKMDPTLFETHDFYLGARLKTQDPQKIKQFTQTVKITSPADMDVCLSMALPGISLITDFKLPKSIECQPEFEYFKLDKTDLLWEAVVSACAVMITVLEAFEDVAIVMMTVPV